jgi:S-methylmethionine-dependent homocysteine/selenocysteine methylase/SAM-dependent methyltransferase
MSPEQSRATTSPPHTTHNSQLATHNSQLTTHSYGRIQRLIADEECVILDGGLATELERVGPAGYRNPDKGLWGTAALYEAPYAVLQVHRAYVATGCDVISTDTWGILSAPEMEAEGWLHHANALHWMDIARLGIRLGRQAIDEAGRTDSCALAFAVSGDVDRRERQETISLLTRIFADEPPDLILLETLSLIRDDVTFSTVEMLLGTGLPVWLSFRRCRHGVCGVHGEHWGGPEGDLFGRAARRFEEMGVGALLINCLPPDHVPGMLSWLRDFTDLPLGVYPNLGYHTGLGWQFDPGLGPEEYAELALRWREEGAQIIGGCCGVTPDHIVAVRKKVAHTKPGHRRPAMVSPDTRRADPRSSGPPPSPAPPGAADLLNVSPASQITVEPWTDDLGRTLYPLPVPNLVVEPGVFQPTLGSFLLWKYLFRTAAGKAQRCLDVGCGTGILTVQLALNGAEHVHAIDIQREAVANTLANAFRNSVAERVTGESVDLYAWQPHEAYDLIVASLYQMPVDPFGPQTSHRPVDYWGRNLLDHLIGQLSNLLTGSGVAYIMQLSILSQVRTAQLVESIDFQVKVVDFTFFPFSPIFKENAEQIQRVERLSDAYHFTVGSEDTMVAYLLEIKRREPSSHE